MPHRSDGVAKPKPTEIPLPGWKDVLWRIYRAIAEDRILLKAAGPTFNILLAMVPSQRR